MHTKKPFRFLRAYEETFFFVSIYRFIRTSSFFSSVIKKKTKKQGKRRKIINIIFELHREHIIKFTPEIRSASDSESLSYQINREKQGERRNIINIIFQYMFFIKITPLGLGNGPSSLLQRATQACLLPKIDLRVSHDPRRCSPQ